MDNKVENSHSPDACEHQNKRRRVDAPDTSGMSDISDISNPMCFFSVIVPPPTDRFFHDEAHSPFKYWSKREASASTASSTDEISNAKKSSTL